MWDCSECGCQNIAPDVTPCPQCRKGTMPKITTAGGPTNADDTSADGPVPAPAKSASKADWVDHAVAQGVPRENAEAMSKQELVEKHGDAAPHAPKQTEHADDKPEPDEQDENQVVHTDEPVTLQPAEHDTGLHNLP
jgi:hypothetical protein